MANVVSICNLPFQYTTDHRASFYLVLSTGSKQIFCIIRAKHLSDYSLTLLNEIKDLELSLDLDWPKQFALGVGSLVVAAFSNLAVKNWKRDWKICLMINISMGANDASHPGGSTREWLILASHLHLPFLSNTMKQQFMVLSFTLWKVQRFLIGNA